MTKDNSCSNNPSACSTCFNGTPCTSPGRYPAGVQHQSAVIMAIHHILNMPSPAFDAFKIGNGFNKVVRNYQYWVEELKPRVFRCPYNSDVLAPIYFRMTEDACKQLKKNVKSPKQNALHGVHQEHAVPVSMVVDELVALRGSGKFTPTQIEKIVRTSEIILVTDDERERLDWSEDKKSTSGKPCYGLRAKMPDVNGSKWTFGDCHLARICKITKTIVGTRML